MTATPLPGSRPVPDAGVTVPDDCDHGAGAPVTTAPSQEASATQPDAVHADPVAEAFRSWMRTCSRSGWAPDPVIETVAVRDLQGRVTAGPVIARWSVPAYRAAAMDGIAVLDHDLSDARPQILQPDAYTWVDTGDVLPSTADRVVMREHVTARDDGSIELSERSSARHIRPVGEDIEAGAVVLPGGHRIRPVDLAVIAAAGYVSITVRRRPRVAVVPTGDEIRPLGTALTPGEILDTNSLMLEGLLTDAGCEAWGLPVVPDDPDDLATAIAGAAETADLLLVIAGSSAGRDDHTATVIERLGQVAVHGIAVRPGHPVVLGVLGGSTPDAGTRRPAAPPVPVVGVPGYPASAERSFEGLVRPLIDRILGVGPAVVHPVAARLAVTVNSTPRVDEYLRVRVATVVDPMTATEQLVAVPLPRGSGALSTLTHAEAVLQIPAGVGHFTVGSSVMLVPVGGATFAAGTTIVAGRTSASVDALGEVHRADAAACVLHFSVLPDEASLDALAAGLCHAATTTLPLGGTAYEAAAEGLATRLGPITVLEIARYRDRVDTLIVPAAAFDSAPIVELRSSLSSMSFRRRLRDMPGLSGRTSGHETWYAPPDGAAAALRPAGTTQELDESVNGASRCATR